MPDPVTLRYLTLQPTDVAAVPDLDDADFDRQLADEAARLFDHEGWAERKSWHGGIVDTFLLPQDCVTYDPALASGQSGPSPTGNAGEEGILWHKRVSRFKASEHGGYDVWYDAMGDRHIEQEEEYVDNLVNVIDVGKDAGKEGCYCKLYKLPFGATDRSFMAHCRVVSPSLSTEETNETDDKSASSKKPKGDSASESNDGLREFLVFSLPITTSTDVKEEKKYVRGTQATVERVRELEGGTIEWSCASLSTPGGNIPVKLSESKMANSLADAVPSILAWMNRSHPPGASHIKSGTYTADTPANAQKPARLRQTQDAANPGGGMGLMPAGRFTLEMFQKEVPLRDY
ncbi:uncharacterized protein JCM10292_002890 [Rhodotorula paludigena]|uniref:uncharacterized protein n=1 Tax=Rhodotorula paludigena TaxID=86838 RepID=UPI003172968A